MSLTIDVAIEQDEVGLGIAGVRGDGMWEWEVRVNNRRRGEGRAKDRAGAVVEVMRTIEDAVGSGA